MLGSKGFDLLADGYDKSVGLSDKQGTYPFAGYEEILGEIYSAVLSSHADTVLDIGLGTGVLSSKLYEQGLSVFGQDFSPKMPAAAAESTPTACRTRYRIAASWTTLPCAAAQYIRAMDD